MSMVPETRAAIQKSRDGISINYGTIKRDIELNHSTFSQSALTAHPFTVHIDINHHFMPANIQKELQP